MRRSKSVAFILTRSLGQNDIQFVLGTFWPRMFCDRKSTRSRHVDIDCHLFEKREKPTSLLVLEFWKY
jgi:hypothetical protein